MKKLLPLLFVVSGCMSVAYTAVKNKDPDECVPPPVIAADIVVGAVATYGGILAREPVMSATGGVYLGLSTLLWFAQMGECGWLH